MTASLVAERLSEHLIENCEFDEIMRKAVMDFIHTDRATAQVCYEADTKEERVEGLTFVKDPNSGEVIAMLGDQRFDGEIVQEEGAWFGVREVVDEKSQKIYLSPASFKEILHTPHATCQEEITEYAYPFSMPMEKAVKRFNLQGLNVQWTHGRRHGEDKDKKDDKSKAKFLEGYEIFDDITKKVRWVAPDCIKNQILDERDDYLELRDFFPSPKFIIGSQPSDHLFPTPAYVHLEKIIAQMHSLGQKIFKLIDGIRRRALVDASHPKVFEAFDKLGDQEFITIEDLSGIVEKSGGTLNNLVWYIPVQELVSAIQELKTLDEYFELKFEKWFGVPDILQGSTDPAQSAASARIESGAAHDRFRYTKRQIQQLARDLIEMMLDLAVKFYSPAKIARITGMEFSTPEHQRQFMAALEILKDDEERMVRIEIETDSTSFVDEQLESQQRNAVVQTITGGIGQLAPLIREGAPEFAATALKAIFYSLDGLKGSEEILPEVESLLKPVIEKAFNPPPPPEPQPDYEILKIEQKERELQLRAQETQQKALFEIEKIKVELAKLQANQSVEQLEVQVRAQSEAAELNIKQQELAIKSQEQQAAATYEQVVLALKAQQQQFEQQMAERDQVLSEFKAQLEAAHVALSEREKLIEEQRLATQTNIEEAKLQVDAIKSLISGTGQPQQPTTPNLTVNINEEL